MLWTTAAVAATWTVDPGEDVQATLDAAADGDTVVLEPGVHAAGCAGR
ncbi:MAG: hypothetical protein GY913_07990 [Proteobacteria bacterium]|nr:hypothetical protein [Pseudomonadota bacterium]